MNLYTATKDFLVQEFYKPYTPFVCSGLCMAAVLHPFYVWWLAFVAMVPFFIAAAQSHRSVKNVFVGGWIVGAMTVAPFLWMSLIQLPFEIGGSVYVYAIRATGVLTVITIGCLFGLLGVLYRRMQSRVTLLQAVVGAALYCLVVEVPIFAFYQGYYYGALSHAVVDVSLLRVYAAIVGTMGVSFLVALFNTALATLLSGRTPQRAYLFGTYAVCVAFLLVGGVVYKAALANAPTPSVSVAVVQPASLTLNDLVGNQEEGVFSHPQAEALIQRAAQESDIVLYPLSPAGVVYRGKEPDLPDVPLVVEDEKIGEWVSSLVPASTTVILWDTISEDGRLFDELAFWRGGLKEGYRKERLYAFSDYTPDWAQFLGIEKSPVAIHAGDNTTLPRIEDHEVAGLICSEVNQVSLARQHSVRASVLFAVGWDAMFLDDMSAQFTLAAARYRAVENNSFVVRGNLLGPSAIINPDGSIQSYAAFAQREIIHGRISLEERLATFYAQQGNAPLYVFLLSVVLLGAFAPRKVRG